MTDPHEEPAPVGHEPRGFGVMKTCQCCVPMNPADVVSKFKTSDGWRFACLERAKEWADTRTREDSWCGRVYSVLSLDNGHAVVAATDG